MNEEMVNKVNALIGDIAKNGKRVYDCQQKGEFDAEKLLTLQNEVVNLKSRWNDVEDELMVEDFLTNGPGRTRDVNYENN